MRAFEEAAAPHLGPTQTQQAASFQSLLASQDPTKLSGSEMANIERGLGRMGIGVGRTSNMDVIGASHQFGDALAQKQQRLAQALAQTAPVASSFKPQISPGFMIGQSAVPNVTGQQQLSNFGDSASQAMSAVAGTTRSQQPKQSGGQYLLNALTGD